MHPLIYDVAVSLDGFIAGPDADVSAFPAEGRVVAAYLARLKSYRHCIMGRRTYEFGYSYRLPLGANPYPEMETLVFSDTLDLPAGVEVVQVRGPAAMAVRALQARAVGPVYLCGGAFAGALLAERLIDILSLKCVSGSGRRHALVSGRRSGAAAAWHPHSL